MEYFNYYTVSSSKISALGVVSSDCKICSIVRGEVKTFLSIQKQKEMEFGDSDKNLYCEITLMKKKYFFVFLFLMKLQFLNKYYVNVKVSHERKILGFDHMYSGIMTVS